MSYLTPPNSITQASVTVCNSLKFINIKSGGLKSRHFFMCKSIYAILSDIFLLTQVSTASLATLTAFLMA